MEVEHGLTCECGQTFQNPEELRRHVTIEKIKDETRRIIGLRLRAIISRWEDSLQAGDLQESTSQQDLELAPENATEIAKKQIIHTVRHFDKYDVPGFHTESEQVENP